MISVFLKLLAVLSDIEALAKAWDAVKKLIRRNKHGR